MRIRVAALSVALAVLTAACGSTSAAPPAAGSTTPVAVTSSGLGEQRSEAAAVTVVASWLAGGASARVAMDTHSVDLDGFDLRTLARMRLDGGPWVAPSAWDAPKGGHHREGTLAFGALDRASFDAAEIIELEVRDVGMPSRILRWERP